MKIEHKEVLTFIVESSNSGEIYEVNLAVNRPHGWCNCPDYEYRQRANQKIQAGGRCKHIMAVREHIVEKVITDVVTARTIAAQKNIERSKANNGIVQTHRPPSTHRPPPVSALQHPPIPRPPPPHPAECRPAVGPGTRQPHRPLPTVPRLGQEQPKRSV